VANKSRASGKSSRSSGNGKHGVRWQSATAIPLWILLRWIGSGRAGLMKALLMKHPKRCGALLPTAVHGARMCGVRWQSATAIPLWILLRWIGSGRAGLMKHPKRCGAIASHRSPWGVKLFRGIARGFRGTLGDLLGEYGGCQGKRGVLYGRRGWTCGRQAFVHGIPA
jgi:hypothetical protein